MRSLRSIRHIAFVVLVALPLQAQETARPLLGAGISIDPLFGERTIVYAYPPGPFYSAPHLSLDHFMPIRIYFPINILSNLRVEPAIGYYRDSDEENTTVTNYPGGTSYSTYITEATVTHVGLGAGYVLPMGEGFYASAGVRLGLSFTRSKTSSRTVHLNPPSSSEYRYESSIKREDFSVGPMFGGEYYPIARFSIGGEAGVNYFFYGDPDETITPPPSSPATSERKRHTISTGVLFFVRWFFL